MECIELNFNEDIFCIRFVSIQTINSQLLSLNHMILIRGKIYHHSNSANARIIDLLNTHSLYLETLVSGGLSRLWDLAVSVTISGTSDGVGQVSATTSSHSSTALSLVGPVKSSHFSIGVTARTTTLVLDVVGATIATITGSVVVLATETETGGTLRHLSQETRRMFVTNTDRLFWSVEFFFEVRGEIEK
jgi:hypothetical protein